MDFTCVFTHSLISDYFKVWTWFKFISELFFSSSGSVHGGSGGEAVSSHAQLFTLQPASSGPPGTSPRQRGSPHRHPHAGSSHRWSGIRGSCLSVSLCRSQKREKRKEEEQRRKQWVDQEREKTLSRLRSFREVRVSFCSLNLPGSSQKSSIKGCLSTTRCVRGNERQWSLFLVLSPGPGGPHPACFKCSPAPQQDFKFCRILLVTHSFTSFVSKQRNFSNMKDRNPPGPTVNTTGLYR